MKLSILVCSVDSRRNTFLPVMLERLFSLAERHNDVEVLFLVDNKKMSIGAKRNALVDAASGEYVVFVDDDDRIADSYITDLLQGINTGVDVVTFTAEVSVNGSTPKNCYYSKNLKYEDLADRYNRPPNHLSCIKKELMLKARFPNISYGEDTQFGNLLQPLINTEYVVNKVLYYYDYNSNTSESIRRG